MLKCGLQQKEREEVDVALGCYEQLWKTIHQTTTVSSSMRSTMMTWKERTDSLNLGLKVSSPPDSQTEHNKCFCRHYM